MIYTDVSTPKRRLHIFSEILRSHDVSQVHVCDATMRKGDKTLITTNRIFRRWFLPTFRFLPYQFKFVIKLIADFIVLLLLILLENPAIVIVSIPGTTSLFPTWLTCKILSKKLIVDIRDPCEETHSRKVRILSRVIRKMFYLIYSTADGIITVTSAMLNKYRNINPKILLVPNFVDVNLFKPASLKKRTLIRKSLNLSADDFIIIYSGKLGYPYRIDVLLTAIRTLKDRGLTNIKLLLVGKPEGAKNERFDYNLIQSLVDKVSVHNQVIIMPFMEQSKLVDYLSSADVGVIPRDRDSLWKDVIPIKFYEYCACGLPVVATVYEDSLLAKLIKKNQIGLISPPVGL